MDIRSLLQALLKSHSKAASFDVINHSLHESLEAALDWIYQAHKQTGYMGISKGYDIIRRNWGPAYPETTGYTIPTLLNTGLWLNRPDLTSLALTLSDKLLEIVTSEGGIAHWKSTPVGEPIVFDTGQVIFGWLSAYQVSGDRKYLNAAQRAGNWLINIQHPDGMWKSNQYLGYDKVIDTRVVWALLLLAQQAGDKKSLVGIRKNLDWALSNQDSDGWFRHCSFTPEQDALTHTIAYTVEGLFESGLILDEDKYVNSAIKTADALLAKQRLDGSLPGLFAKEWQATSRWSCLTGDCQIAALWLRMNQYERRPEYVEGAKKLISFIVNNQYRTRNNQNLYGGLAGSSPVTGAYERFKLPNWTAKFFIDVLLTLFQSEQQEELIIFKG